MTPVSVERDGALAVVTISNPPVNALSHAVRSALEQTFKELSDDDTTKAVVLIGDGRFFVAGADINEFGKPLKEPNLPGLINFIEATDLITVAAIHGMALGGGLELSLGCGHRIAARGARFSLPETQLGLLPGAGGTQRVPRLIGLRRTFEMVTSPKQLTTEDALEVGLIDEVVELDALKESAKALAISMIDKPKRRVGEFPKPNPNPEALAEFTKRYQKDRPGQFALAQAIQSVAASAELPIKEGMKQERERFYECMKSPERDAFIHAFFAERRCAKVPGLEVATPREITSVGVIGGGTMGAGIVASALLSGLSATMIERDQDAVSAGRDRVMGILKGALKRGKLKQSRWEEIEAGAFNAGEDYTLLSDVDLVIEAVFEDMDVKKQVFAKLDAACKEDAILATNTSYLDINEIAVSTSRPGQVIGLHFFSPAHIMKLLEIVEGDHTDPTTLVTSFAFAKKLKKTAVRAGVCDGFIGNRILSVYRLAADYMVADGATPYEIDEALRNFGFPMGPYQVSDLAGLDIGWATRKRRAATRDPKERYVTFLDKICEQGWFGRKTGRGIYIYDDENPSGKPDNEVLRIIGESRGNVSESLRTFSESQILARYMAAMVNEAAKVIDEGIALRPSDVDVTFLYGYGFPRYRGGPTHYADTVGIKAILDDIKKFAEEDAFFWQPAPLLEKLAHEGRTFAELNET